MFDILRLPSQDSHIQEFEALQAQALQDGNDRDERHWQSMIDMERCIAGKGQENEQSIPSRIQSS